jgi:uncharacterized membrane protein
MKRWVVVAVVGVVLASGATARAQSRQKAANGAGLRGAMNNSTLPSGGWSFPWLSGHGYSNKTNSGSGWSFPWLTRHGYSKKVDQGLPKPGGRTGTGGTAAKPGSTNKPPTAVKPQSLAPFITVPSHRTLP